MPIVGGEISMENNKAGKENGACWQEGDSNFLGRKRFTENVIFD